MSQDERAKKRPALLRVAFLLMGMVGFLTPHLISAVVVQSAAAQLEHLAQSRRPQKALKPPAAKKPRIDYSRFTHSSHVTQQKLSCDSCHKFPTKNWKEVRKVDSAFPDVAEFPEHTSCLSCHRQQFFARERPAPAICSNCHLSVTPRDTARFLFPSLGDISDSLKPMRDLIPEFAVNFPHDKHIDVVGLSTPLLNPVGRSDFVRISWQEKSAPKADPPKSCPICHQTSQPQGTSSEEYITKPPKDLGDAFWLKKGTFKTLPNSHAVCFTCHNAETEIAPAPSDCNACHKLAAPQTQSPQAGIPLEVVRVLKADFDPKLAQTIGVTDMSILMTWQRRISAGAFRHEGGEHPDVSCTNCHQVANMNTIDRKTLRVPVRSCGGAEGCHVTATTDDGGILNYEIDQKKANPGFVCTKCHISFGKEAVPRDHVEAVPPPNPKVKSSL